MFDVSLHWWGLHNHTRQVLRLGVFASSVRVEVGAGGSRVA